MRKFKMMALAMGLAFTALHATDGAAALTCQEQCRRDYKECLVICSKNPCFVACETVLQFCLNNCGSES